MQPPALLSIALPKLKSWHKPLPWWQNALNGATDRVGQKPGVGQGVIDGIVSHPTHFVARADVVPRISS